MEITEEEINQIVSLIQKQTTDLFKGFRITKHHQLKCTINCMNVLITNCESILFSIKTTPEEAEKMLEYKLEIYQKVMQNLMNEKGKK